jgi:hypothetical protein
MPIQDLVKVKCVQRLFGNIFKLEQMRFILKIKLINSLKVFPKRCGHLDGKSLISIDDMVNKIKISA